MKPELNFVVEKLETRLEMQVIAAPISTNACAGACLVSPVQSSCALQPMFR
ncbi:MAG TPA: hypothetical protein VIE43_07605 [Thermoanaerobaculia bacterium]|jgi:hypothetical protein|nr:hypothetical protein [Thermoanaerobaculia bacterium]